MANSREPTTELRDLMLQLYIKLGINRRAQNSTLVLTARLENWFDLYCAASCTTRRVREYLHGIANWPMPAQGWPAKWRRRLQSRPARPTLSCLDSTSSCFFSRELANFKSRCCCFAQLALSSWSLTCAEEQLSKKTRFAQSGLFAGKWHTWTET